MAGAAGAVQRRRGVAGAERQRDRHQRNGACQFDQFSDQFSAWQFDQLSDQFSAWQFDQFSD